MLLTSPDSVQYTIKGFVFDRDPKYSKEGVHAKNFSFKLRDRQTNTEQLITVYDYFKRTYNITLEHWYLPLIETARGGHFPMEVCTLVPNQKYAYKLSPEQTSSMIKFAVTRPNDRIESIKHGVGMLKWNNDKYLNHFGIKIDPNMTIVSLS